MKKAFTLAEVLITLGIIGIVAALTLPNLIGSYKKQETVSRLKKTYSILNQALLMSEKDNDVYKNWNTPIEIGKQQYFEKYWKPYIKLAKYCDTYTSCSFKNPAPWLYLDGSGVQVSIGMDSVRIPFYLQDGTFVVIGETNPFTNGEAEHTQYIWIDTNGYKPPNTMGKDFFRFAITTKTGKIDPDGIGNSDENIQKHCSKDGNGVTCAAKIISDGWEIKDDYPW